MQVQLNSAGKVKYNNSPIIIMKWQTAVTSFFKLVNF